jgi:hypothetical protein
VHVGRSYLSTAESGYDVRRTVTTAIHASYNADTSAADLALLLLDSPATKAPVALAAALPTNNTPVTVMGFGTTSEGSPYLSGAVSGAAPGVSASAPALSAVRTFCPAPS